MIAAPPPQLETASGQSELVRIVLPLLAALFLVLALAPWRAVVHPVVDTGRTVLWRVTLASIGISVGIGYLIVTYLGGRA